MSTLIAAVGVYLGFGVLLAIASFISDARCDQVASLKSYLRMIVLGPAGFVIEQFKY